MKTFEIAYYIVLLITYLSLILNFKKFRFNDSILYFIAFSVLVTTELLANIQYHKFNTLNYFSHFLGKDIIYALICLFFYYQLAKNKKWVGIILLIYALFNFILLSSLFYQSLDFESFNHQIMKEIKISYFINMFLFLSVILNFIYETFNSNKILNLKYYFPFWITTSLLVNLVGKFPNYMFLANGKENVDWFGVINAIISIIGFLVLTVGIFLNKDISNKKTRDLLSNIK